MICESRRLEEISERSMNENNSLYVRERGNWLKSTNCSTEHSSDSLHTVNLDCMNSFVCFVYMEDNKIRGIAIQDVLGIVRANNS